jgi:hypothetical protein
VPTSACPIRLQTDRHVLTHLCCMLVALGRALGDACETNEVNGFLQRRGLSY